MRAWGVVLALVVAATTTLALANTPHGPSQRSRQSHADALIRGNHSVCAQSLRETKILVFHEYYTKTPGWTKRINRKLYERERLCHPTLLFRECENAHTYVQAIESWCTRRRDEDPRSTRHQERECIEGALKVAAARCKDFNEFSKLGILPKSRYDQNIPKTHQFTKACERAQRLYQGGRVACVSHYPLEQLVDRYLCIKAWKAFRHHACGPRVKPPPPPPKPVLDVRAFWDSFEAQKEKALRPKHPHDVIFGVSKDHELRAEIICKKAHALRKRQEAKCLQVDPHCSERLSAWVEKKCRLWKMILDGGHTTMGSNVHLTCPQILANAVEIGDMCDDEDAHCLALHTTQTELCMHREGLKTFHECQAAYKAKSRDHKCANFTDAFHHNNCVTELVMKPCEAWIDVRCDLVHLWLQHCGSNELCKETFEHKQARFQCEVEQPTPVVALEHTVEHKPAKSKGGK